MPKGTSGHWGDWDLEQQWFRVVRMATAFRIDGRGDELRRLIRDRPELNRA